VTGGPRLVAKYICTKDTGPSSFGFGIDHLPQFRKETARGGKGPQPSFQNSKKNQSVYPARFLRWIPPRLLVSTHTRFLISPSRLIRSRPIPPSYRTMFTLTMIPSITITPAVDDSTTTTTPLPTPSLPPTASAFTPASVANLSMPPKRFQRRHSTAAVLPLPPLAAAHDDRVSLAQSGMPVGSFKLNCVESIGALSPPRFSKHDITGQTPPSVASARGMAVAKVFGWTTADGAAEFLNNSNINGSNSSGSGGLSSPRSQSRSRHTRARSLNSLADLGIPPPHQPSPPPEALSRRSRYRSLGMDMNMNLGETKFSIDLAVLDSTPSPSEPGLQFSFPRRS